MRSTKVSRLIITGIKFMSADVLFKLIPVTILLVSSFGCSLVGDSSADRNVIVTDDVEVTDDE